MEDIGIPWLQVWDDTKLAFVLVHAFASQLHESP
jgi:hypothetical protein